MEEVKKQRGGFTECIENQSSLFEASVIKYLKIAEDALSHIFVDML